MKTILTLAALLASASLIQAGPAITPAKVKRPLQISQVKSLFHRSQPSVTSAGGATGTASTTTAAVSPVSKKVHVRTFLNHPVTAPGPH